MELKEYFHQPYQGRDSFLEHVIFPIFGEDNFDDGYDESLLENNPELIKAASAAGIASICHIGTIDIDFNPINIFDIHVDNHVLLGRNRVSVQQLVRRIMSTYSSAFMIFHYDDSESWDWRFTFCSKRGNNDEGTDNKRYTFLLGPGQSCRTAAENFTKLLQKSGDIQLKDIESAFDVEALSNEFFEKYKGFYERFVEYITGKRFVKQGGKWVEKSFGEPHPEMYPAFGSDDKRVRDYVKKLLGRIVFLHFLQKKGWLGVPVDGKWGEGDKQFMKHLYEYASKEQQDDYLDAVLEPLFADGLDKRSDDSIFDTHVAFPNGSRVKVPYLNGGLFERDNLDEIPTRFPAEFFGDLLEFLYQYNFTIDENDPNDAEVGVDPEMLGRIFENLLEDNKDKGAYYTPKEIVRYMCRESLVSYLTTHSINAGNKHARTDVEKAIRDLLTTPETVVPKMQVHHKDTLEEFGNALREVRICDPAIGSGAFPMGLLNELVHARVSIGAWAKRADGTQMTDDYAALKREIVCDNIYGVDIERGAIDIARLRFWLSIIVDEHEPRPLPNLDYKFMQGNSLITTFAGEYVNLDTKNQQHLNVTKMLEAKKRLFELKKAYYSASGQQKYQLDVDIKNCILQLVSLQLDYEMRSWHSTHVVQGSLFDDSEEKLSFAQIKADLPEDRLRIIEIGQALRQRLADTSIPLQERAQTDIKFFDWRIMFTEVFNRPSGENGFDIVIGNPPYVQLQGNGGEFAGQFENCHFETFARTGDIYCLFYEKGWQLLKQGGDLCFITSNKWMRAGYGEKTRAFFAHKTNPKLLIDFAGTKIFDSATVDTNILLFCKEDNAHQTICAVTDKQNKNCLNKLSDFVQQQHSVCGFSTSDSWVVLSPIEQSIKQKIESVGTPLKDWDINIYRGVLTGYNEAFIISTEKRDEILANCATEEERTRTAELIRPILRGRDIKRYAYEWANLWLINTHNGVKGKIERIHIEDYPAVKAHLDLYWDKISKRADKGDTPYNLRNCAYLEDFSKPKIVWAELARTGNAFALDFENHMVGNTGYVLTCPSSSHQELLYLLAFLNSRSTLYSLNHLTTRFDENGWRWLRQFVEQLHIPPFIQMENILSIVSSINKENKRDISEEINNAIADIYGLSEEEVEYINNSLLGY